MIRTAASQGCAELVASAYRRSYFSAPGDRVVGVATALAGNVIGGGDWAQDRLLPDCMKALAAGRCIAELFDQMTERHCAAVAAGVRCDDPAFAIDWPIKPPILSDRDASHVSFRGVAEVGR